MKSKIVACLIVKNESSCLEKCLESIKEADAIYIVDTGSTDNTVEIAKKYTENVFEDYKWDDNFAEARQHVLNKVKEEHAYILSIDADEYLHDFTKVREATIQAEKTNALAADVKLIAEGDGQVHYYPRFFKKDPEVFWIGAVHNHISSKPGFTSEIEITYGYSPAHIKDPNRSFRILQKEVAKTGNARETYYLGREYWYSKLYKECAETMEIYLSKAHFLAEKADAYLVAAKCYWAMGLPDKARQSCAQAIVINAHFKEAILFMATLAGKGTGNPTWEMNGEQWERMGQTASNEGVLFIRDLPK